MLSWKIFRPITMVRAPMFLVFKRNAYFCNTVVNISMYCIKKKKYKSNKNTKPKSSICRKKGSHKHIHNLLHCWYKGKRSLIEYTRGAQHKFCDLFLGLIPEKSVITWIIVCITPELFFTPRQINNPWLTLTVPLLGPLQC